MENGEQRYRPTVFTTNVMIKETFLIHYPILATNEQTGDVAIVARVTATSTKIDFWIDVKHPLKLEQVDLLPDDWKDAFERNSQAMKKFDIRGASQRGWTNAIMELALERYQEWYKNRPQCMVGVFDKDNQRLFWNAFTELYPGKRMADFDEQTRANIAGQCIESTRFWPPRKAHGYETLQFEVDALADNRVLVRAYLNDLSEGQILSITTSVKTHDYLKEDYKYDNWKFANVPS